MERYNLNKMHRVTVSAFLCFAVVLGVIALLTGLLQPVSFSASAQTVPAVEQAETDSEAVVEEAPADSPAESDASDGAPAPAEEAPVSNDIPEGDAGDAAPSAEEGLDAEALGEALGASPMALPSNGRLSCAPGDFYSISNTGAVRGFRSLGGNSFTADGSNSATLVNAFPYATDTTQFNGLGISFGGDRAFAFQRMPNSGQYWEGNQWRSGGRIAVFDWVPGAYNVQATRTFTIPQRSANGTTYGGDPFGAAEFIAGAVNPENGAYYMGGYSISRDSYTEWVPGRYEPDPRGGYWYQDYYGNWYWYQYPDRWVPGYERTIATGYEVRFNLYKYDPAAQTLVEVGYVPVYNTERYLPDYPNGDIAFDANGNLFILFHDGGQLVRTVPVTSANLLSAERTPSFTQRIEPQSVTDVNVNVSGTQFNGLAFNYDGNMIVENSGSGSPVTFRLIDPSTGRINGQSTRYELTFGTDLASCTGFPTIELKKDVVSRYTETDQFILEIDRVSNGVNVPVSDTRTEGTATGVQEQQAGPVPAVVGQTYIVREVGSVEMGSDAEPALLKRYKTDLRCVNTSTGAAINLTEIAEPTGEDNFREWSFVVPPASSFEVPIVSCTYVNESNVASVQWAKVNGDGEKLAGSEWEIRGVSDSDFRLPILDCVAGDASEPTNPANPGTPVDEDREDPCINDRDENEGEFLVEDLQYGDYELVETKAPDGYSTIEPIKFTVDGTENPIELGDVVNELLTGELIWNKVDEEGQALAGSVWTLRGPEGADSEELEVVDNEGQDGYDGLDTDPAPGAFKVEDLTLGKYTLVEKTAPEGYVKTGQEFPVELTSEEFTITLDDIVNKPTAVEWVKVDSEDNELLLPGSEWTLTGLDSAEDVLAVIDNGENDADATDGKLRVEKLPVGRYILEETKAPEGYVVLETTWVLDITDEGFEFKEEGSEEVIASGTFAEGDAIATAELGNIENTLITGSVIWEKTGTPWLDDPDSKIWLGDSEWTLTPVDGDGGNPTGDALEITDWADEADNYRGEDVDSRAGRFKVEGLVPGWYQLVETKAPVGFIKDETPRYIQITGDEEVNFGSINNEVYDTTTLPETGGRGVLPAIALGGLIVAIGALMASRKKTRFAQA